MRSGRAATSCSRKIYALIAEVVEDPHDVRGQSCGLWWESADTARARCALAMFEGGQFRGVVLVAFSGLTTGEEDRVDARRRARAGAAGAGARPCTSLPTRRSQVLDAPPARDVRHHDHRGAAFRRATRPDDALACDLEALGREEQLLVAHRRARCARTNSRCTCSPSFRCATTTRHGHRSSSRC